MMARRSRNLMDLMQDLTDDIKDFVDDELVDRGRTAERDVRRGGRNLFDYDDDRRGRRRSRYSDDIADLRAAVTALRVQVTELAAQK
jgi:hypothetical protein